MNAPVLLPGDWVYLKVSLNTSTIPGHVDGVRQAPEQVQQAGEAMVREHSVMATKVFNAMGVHVVATWESWGDDLTSGVEVVTVFRNGIVPIDGRAPGL